MVAQGNQAAAWSLGGVAIGLALPLCSVVMHAQSWGELVVWSLLSLASQIVLWFVLGHTVFAHIKASMEKGTESVGILLGACAISFGLMVAACAS
jgi:putative membrane protein